jgi:ankyrin repeat protein
MGKHITFKRPSLGNGGAQSLKSFALCAGLAAALAGVFWYGGMRAEPSSPSPEPEPFLSSPLLEAMRHRDRAAFARELDRLPSIDAVDADGMTAVLAVACCGDIEDLKSILTRNPDIHCAQRARGTPLMAVLMRGDAAATRLLLQRGADPCGVMGSGDCPLLAAIRGGSEECLEMIVESVRRRGGDLFPPGLRESPLSYAASDDGQMPMLRRLLAAGVDPNRAGANGELPLITALVSDAPSAATLLLNAGADVDLPDGRGRIARTLPGSDPRLAVASRRSREASRALADARPGHPGL